MTNQDNPHNSIVPIKNLPVSDWEHYPLYRSVCEAIASLPVYFRTETQISGIMATDLHTLNTVLGATIEEQVVSTLNLMRSTWGSRGEIPTIQLCQASADLPRCSST